LLIQVFLKNTPENGTFMEKNETEQTGLTSAQIRKFKALLLAKRAKILGDVLCMENETLRKQHSDISTMPIHPADLGTDNYELENTLGLMDSQRKLLAEINDALGRMQKGTYGICEGANEPIPKQRLEAIPWARYCIACADLSEKAPADRVNSFDKQNYDNSSDDQDENIDNAACR
jgi:DnaK suppressor protein